MLEYSAFNWLEDTHFEEDVHAELHKMGRSVRERFPEGCGLIWVGNRYEHRCPVALCHTRFGFSVGMIVSERRCSICGDDPSECSHRENVLYEVPGGPGPGGSCPVCLKDSCEHSSHQTYPVRRFVHIDKIEAINEVSIVSRPRSPDARLLGIPVDRDVLEEALGQEFQYGQDTVQCSQCLLECQGFSRLPGDPKMLPVDRVQEP
jgi:hypothetical protein